MQKHLVMVVALAVLALLTLAGSWMFIANQHSSEHAGTDIGMVSDWDTDECGQPLVRSGELASKDVAQTGYGTDANEGKAESTNEVDGSSANSNSNDGSPEVSSESESIRGSSTGQVRSSAENAGKRNSTPKPSSKTQSQDQGAGTISVAVPAIPSQLEQVVLIVFEDLHYNGGNVKSSANIIGSRSILPRRNPAIPEVFHTNRSGYYHAILREHSELPSWGYKGGILSYHKSKTRLAKGGVLVLELPSISPPPLSVAVDRIKVDAKISGKPAHLKAPLLCRGYSKATSETLIDGKTVPVAAYTALTDGVRDWPLKMALPNSGSGNAILNLALKHNIEVRAYFDGAPLNDFTVECSYRLWPHFPGAITCIQRVTDGLGRLWLPTGEITVKVRLTGAGRRTGWLYNSSHTLTDSKTLAVDARSDKALLELIIPEASDMDDGLGKGFELWTLQYWVAGEQSWYNSHELSCSRTLPLTRGKYRCLAWNKGPEDAISFELAEGEKKSVKLPTLMAPEATTVLLSFDRSYQDQEYNIDLDDRKEVYWTLAKHCPSSPQVDRLDDWEVNWIKTNCDTASGGIEVYGIPAGVSVLLRYDRLVEFEGVSSDVKMGIAPVIFNASVGGSTVAIRLLPAVETDTDWWWIDAEIRWVTKIDGLNLIARYWVPTGEREFRVYKKHEYTFLFSTIVDIASADEDIPLPAKLRAELEARDLCEPK